MRNNDLRLLSGKLLSEIPESHKFCRALLHCYYNTDPIDPNEDNLEVDTIRAATIFKNLLLNKESFPIEKSSVIIILQDSTMKIKLCSAKITENNSVINFVYDGGPFLAFFEILANITPITENEITYYSRILGIMLNEAVNITRGADTSNLRKLQNDIIDKLLTYPLSVSDSEFRNLRSYCSFEKTAILSKNGFRYTVNQIEALFNKAILDRKWDIIQTYFLDPFPINEDNRNFYNTFFMRLLAEENYDLSLIFLRKNSAQLNYKCSFPSDGDVALHYYMRAGNTEGALLCVQNGADLSIRNKIKKTSIQLAADNSHWKTIIEVLKYSETGVNDTFKCGYALLLMARTKSWAPCHALLNQKNIRLDFQEPNTLLFKEKAAWTALNYFVEAGQDALIALCAARTDAFLSKQNDFIIPEDAKAAYELALANNDCALLEMLNNSDNVAYFINWASYGAAVGNHLDLLAYLTDEGADKKFISAGKIKGLKKTPVTNPHVFLPAPTSNSYESGHSFKSLEHGL